MTFLSRRLAQVRFSWAGAFAAFALLSFVAVTIGYSFTRRPWWDEGLMADVSQNFSHSGHLRSSVLASHTYLDLPGVDRYTYWMFPMYFVSLGMWFRVFPITVESMRLFSGFLGAIYLLSWFLLIRAVSRSANLALVVTAVVALDYSFLMAASNGRMDMICACFGQAGLACYACFRAERRQLGMFLAACCGAASLFCHPMGAVTNLLIAALILRDWRELRLKHFVPILIPYLVAGVLCGAFIAQAPEIFVAQYRAGTAYRIRTWSAALAGLTQDFTRRYLGFYYLHVSGATRLKIMALVFAIAGPVAGLLNKSLRSDPTMRLLLVFSFLGYLGVGAIDNQNFHYYLIYSTPMFAACGALWVYESLQSRRFMARLIPITLLACSVSVTLAGFALSIVRDEYKSQYVPAVQTVKSHLPPGGIVYGPSELAFAFGFGLPLVDDCYLGYSSGTEPDVYVREPVICAQGVYPASHTAWDWSRRTLARDYKEQFSNEVYEVYVRNHSQARGSN